MASSVRVRLEGNIEIRVLLEELRPIYIIDLALSLLGLAVAFATIPVHSQFPVLFIAPLFAMLRFFSRERHERLEQLVELNDAYQGTALLLGDVVEADDAYTGEHCKSVVRLARDVAGKLGLDADQNRNVEFAALLHDVGKIAVPKKIINKRGKLDAREWEIIKTHTIEGQKMLDRIGGFMREIGRIVRASHERWDGTGYPDGLSGHAIPIEARIVSACDAFNAMTTTRAYREAMSLSDAICELNNGAGSQFDPHVVRGLLSVLGAPVSTTVPGPDSRGSEARGQAPELPPALGDTADAKDSGRLRRALDPACGEDRPAEPPSPRDRAASAPFVRRPPVGSEGSRTRP
jgi:putative nucleotidyltransferase with HDIG domain